MIGAVFHCRSEALTDTTRSPIFHGLYKVISLAFDILLDGRAQINIMIVKMENQGLFKVLSKDIDCYALITFILAI